MPLLSAMNVFGVAVRVLVTTGLVSIAVAEPGVDAVLVRDRNTVALGIGVPAESFATAWKVTASPAPRTPDAAIGAGGFQVKECTAENAYASVLEAAVEFGSLAVMTSRPEVGSEVAGVEYTMAIAPLLLAV